MKADRLIFVLFSILLFCVSCYPQDQIKFEVTKGSGSDELRTCRGEIFFNKDGIISNYKVFWDNNGGLKDYNFIIKEEGKVYKIIEDNSKEEMWAIGIEGNAVSILFNGKIIAQGSINNDGFDIRYPDGANLLSLTNKGDMRSLKIKKDTYAYKKGAKGLRRFFLPDDGVSVSENKAKGWDTQISELADFGLLSYGIKGRVKDASPNNEMLNSVIFTRNFFDEVFPFVLGEG